jgi:hypothetical protein
LALPDWSKEFIKSDFSNKAMGGALLQEDKNGKIRPNAYVSQLFGDRNIQKNETFCLTHTVLS